MLHDRVHFYLISEYGIFIIVIFIILQAHRNIDSMRGNGLKRCVHCMAC